MNASPIKQRIKMKTLLILSLIITSTFAYGHSGRTDSSGCHNDRINGGYHCHNSDTSQSKVLKDRTIASVQETQSEDPVKKDAKSEKGE